MKIKVLINNIKDQTIINQGLILVKNSLASINFPIEISVEAINKTFNGTTFNNKAVGSGACVIPEQILNSVDGTDDIAFLIYDWGTVLPKPTNPCQSPIRKGNTTPCQMPIQWYMEFPNVFRDFFLHEICHSLYYLNNNVTNDVTHNQFDKSWNGRFNSSPNVDYYLFLLSQLNYNKTVVTIDRISQTPNETTGNLTAKNNGLTFQCKTLELPWKGNMSNISCIPKGEYNVKWTFSLKFLRFTYEIQNVPDRSGIRIHYGNFYKNFQGCIGLGNGFADLNGDSEQDITMTRDTVGAFEQFMRKKDFKLIIN